MLRRLDGRPRALALAAAGLLVLLVGVWLGGHPSWIPDSFRGAFVSDSGGRFVDTVVGQIVHDYYRPVNSSNLLNQGLAGAVASLNDPYSHYFDPADYRSFQEQDNPHVSGIGIDANKSVRGLLVVDVFSGSPAAHAGLRRGDEIVAVGGTSLAGLPENARSSLIKGVPGTRVTLTIIPITAPSTRRAVALTRASVVVPVAAGTLVHYHGSAVGQLTFTSFTDGSGDELRTQVKKVLSAGAQYLILDLRENGGGLLNEAVNVASIFITDGTIVSTAGRSQPRQVYTARGNAIAPRVPMVVLVDSGTASAAEIVTGALRDRGRATVVGTHTYGKGVFQEIKNLSNGGALDLTVGEYFTPDGQNLGGGGVKQGAGIKPTVFALDNPHTLPDEGLAAARHAVTQR